MQHGLDAGQAAEQIQIRSASRTLKRTSESKRVSNSLDDFWRMATACKIKGVGVPPWITGRLIGDVFYADRDASPETSSEMI